MEIAIPTIFIKSMLSASDGYSNRKNYGLIYEIPLLVRFGFRNVAVKG